MLMLIWLHKIILPSNLNVIICDGVFAEYVEYWCNLYLQYINCGLKSEFIIICYFIKI